MVAVPVKGSGNLAAFGVAAVPGMLAAVGMCADLGVLTAGGMCAGPGVLAAGAVRMYVAAIGPQIEQGQITFSAYGIVVHVEPAQRQKVVQRQ